MKVVNKVQKKTTWSNWMIIATHFHDTKLQNGIENIWYAEWWE